MLFNELVPIEVNGGFSSFRRFNLLKVFFDCFTRCLNCSGHGPFFEPQVLEAKNFGQSVHANRLPCHGLYLND